MENERSAEFTRLVTDRVTAEKIGSGSLPVLATPALAAWMEEASCLAAAPLLQEGETSVGTAIRLSHVSATPVGLRVTVRARLVQREGRRLLFSAEAFDECGTIGSAEHERVIVSADRFLEKARRKIL